MVVIGICPPTKNFASLPLKQTSFGLERTCPFPSVISALIVAVIGVVRLKKPILKRSAFESTAGTVSPQVKADFHSIPIFLLKLELSSTIWASI